MSALDIDALKDEWIGVEFEERELDLNPEAMAAYANACGELAPEYTDPSHADFQAPPTFASSLQRGRGLPETFPQMPGLGMDAGKAVEAFAPIRPGPKRSKTHMHDIYTKTGRSGRMIFLVVRMALYETDGTHLANADTRVVIREKPTEREA
ncbi:MAG: MaoC family dehydratase N-terminal domain-containing protein [Pseudomonadota bacterium]